MMVKQATMGMRAHNISEFNMIGLNIYFFVPVPLFDMIMSCYFQKIKNQLDHIIFPF